ncbi:MAG: adenine phosphoribosyltransferase [candidate division Zixibacteria bacterium]|nr:adenine phosphoribosyltransferase [candidate division Zixibacteria bacterium]MDD5425422.1 adenine phosphoribosyltransferase [candidate division Zixibacteria bacterium]
MSDLKKYIRSVPDFPKPGINFYDLTTLFSEPVGFKLALDKMEAFLRTRDTQKILAIESRGFILGAALADRMNLPLIVARKKGKLPYKTIVEDYSLEYGSASLEIHADAVYPGEKVAVVDDLIATGGTLLAACKLVERLKGKIAGISCVVGLVFFPFDKILADYEVNYLISYDSE